jgi:hypothetical protein
MTTHETIEAIVCSNESISIQMLRSTCKNRSRELVFARQLIFYFMRQYTDYSLAEIGALYGKSHASVIHSIKVIKNLCDSDRKLHTKFDLYDLRVQISLGLMESRTRADLEQAKLFILGYIEEGKPIDVTMMVKYNELIGIFN